MGEVVLIGSCAGTFYALDKKTAEVRWSYDIKKDGDQTSFHGNPLITNDLIIIGTDGRSGPEGVGHVYAFEKATGKVRWKYKLTSGVPNGRGVPTHIVGLDSSVYGVAFGDELLCLDLKTGRLSWSFQSEFSRKEFQWSNAPAVAGGRVFFGGVDGTVYALDAQTGKTIWKRPLGSRISTHAILADNSLYVGATDNRVYRINPNTGSVVASFSATATPVGTISHTGKSLIVFLNPKGGAGGAATLVCLDKQLTKVQWSQSVAEGWSLTRAFLWRGNVLAGSETGDVIAYSLTDGVRQWSHRFKGVIRSIGGSDDALYIGTLSGMVYAFVAK